VANRRWSGSCDSGSCTGNTKRQEKLSGSPKAPLEIRGVQSTFFSPRPPALGLQD
jgi:hypothetical protein